jgi:hypothetical protein
VTQGRGVRTICDDLLVIDAGLFGLISLLCYWSLHHQVRRRKTRLDLWISRLFLVAQGLMIVVCGILAWALI